jgi:phytoene synthase
MNITDISKAEKLGFQEARAITKKFAKTFYFASFFLDKKRQAAAYSVYAICRISDETVDDNTSAGKTERLTLLQDKITKSYTDAPLSEPLLLAFRKTVREYQIPKEHFCELIDGMRMDLEKTRYKNFEDLYSYCYKVAAVVGLIMLKIFGARDFNAAAQYAVNLGIAMQLTNILRDIKEDYTRQRIYLPQDELIEYNINEYELSGQAPADLLKEFLKFQIARAQGYYNDCRPGIKLITGWRSRFVVTAMKEIYAGILESIEKNGYDVFSKRACVNIYGKFFIALRILLRGEC